MSCLQNLANYFDGILHIQMMDRDVDAQPLFFAAGVGQLKVPNMRKLGELPHALLGAGDRERLAQRLCDLEVFVLYSADQVGTNSLVANVNDPSFCRRMLKNPPELLSIDSLIEQPLANHTSPAGQLDV